MKFPVSLLHEYYLTNNEQIHKNPFTFDHDIKQKHTCCEYDPNRGCRDQNCFINFMGLMLSLNSQ